MCFPSFCAVIVSEIPLIITEVGFPFLVIRQILHLDVLVHDSTVNNCVIRANAWDSSLIAKVIKKDSISPGVFGKLQVSSLLFFFPIVAIFMFYSFLLSFNSLVAAHTLLRSAFRHFLVVVQKL